MPKSLRIDLVPDLQRMVGEGITLEDAANRLGLRPADAIELCTYSLDSDSGLYVKDAPLPTIDKDAELKARAQALRDQNATVRAIAREVGKSKSWVDKYTEPPVSTACPPSARSVSTQVRGLRVATTGEAPSGTSVVATGVHPPSLDPFGSIRRPHVPRIYVPNDCGTYHVLIAYGDGVHNVRVGCGKRGCEQCTDRKFYRYTSRVIEVEEAVPQFIRTNLTRSQRQAIVRSLQRKKINHLSHTPFSEGLKLAHTGLLLVAMANVKDRNGRWWLSETGNPFPTLYDQVMNVPGRYLTCKQWAPIKRDYGGALVKSGDEGYIDHVMTSAQEEGLLVEKHYAPEVDQQDFIAWAHVRFGSVDLGDVLGECDS